MNISIRTLQTWRQRQRGPRFFRIGNRIRYKFDDLAEYLQTCAVEPRDGAAVGAGESPGTRRRKRVAVVDPGPAASAEAR